MLKRTTRNVQLTPAGEFLYHESARVLGDVDATLQRLREEFVGGRKQVRVGVSPSVGLAYLPGFFHANLRRRPEVGCRVFSQTSQVLLAALGSNDLDLAVLCPPPKLPKSVTVTHRFTDAFTLLVPAQGSGTDSLVPRRQQDFGGWARQQNWLLLSEASNTGRRLRRWMTQQAGKIVPVMELESFDLIINLVSLGMGVSFVPVRALALYGQKKTLKRVALEKRFARELVVVSRRQRQMPEHLSQFIANVLFGTG